MAARLYNLAHLPLILLSYLWLAALIVDSVTAGAITPFSAPLLIAFGATLILDSTLQALALLFPTDRPRKDTSCRS